MKYIKRVRDTCANTEFRLRNLGSKMVTTKKLIGLWAILMLGAGLSACTTDMETDDIDFSSGIRLTAIHTGDIHSRLLPYDMDLLSTDERLGMNQANEPFGGIARAATVIRQIRSQAQHSVHVDSGDVFQGAPIFNEFNGDPEVQALNYLGMDAFIIGNHEFDNGVSNLYDKMSKAQFTILAANYQWKPSQGNDYLPLRDVARPYTIINAQGVRVAVIGMANFSSMSSSTYGDNNLGITVLENIQVVQSYINLLRNDANIITMVTHLGLGEDEDVIRKTTGLDLVFGGHLHIVLNPPKIIPDNSQIRVNGKDVPAPKMVPLVHSGAFMKYVGHFEGVFYPDYMIRPELYPEGTDKREWDLTMVSHKYRPIPIEATIKDDPELTLLLAPYERELSRRLNLRYVVGYAPQTLKRFGQGGKDSSLGNFLADAMLLRQRVEADFAATNSLGIRTDINQGPVTNDQLYNVFPFPNSISSMMLSGTEVWSLLDYNSYRSMHRGCQSQLQVAGVRYTMDCHTAKQVNDDYLDMGYLFEYQYRAEAFDALCNCKFKVANPEKQCPFYPNKPAYCNRKSYVDPKEENKDAYGDSPNDIYDVHFAKDIKIVRGLCNPDNKGSDCAHYDPNKPPESQIVTCEHVIDTQKGEYDACMERLQPEWFYKFATNNYMSHGGSGFSSLKYNTTQKDTDVELRAILIDGIEKEKSCVEQCRELNPSFDISNPGTCKQLLNCKADTTEFEMRWCKQLYRYSEQEVCLANADKTDNGTGPARCAGLSKYTKYQECLEQNYQTACGGKYYTAAIQSCLEEKDLNNGNKCAIAYKGDGTSESPYSLCVEQYMGDSDYAACAGLNTVSEYDKCAAQAKATAEGICMEVSCFVAGTDGRQNPERPRNESLEAEVSAISSFANGAAIMEALQEAGYDACY